MKKLLITASLAIIATSANANIHKQDAVLPIFEQQILPVSQQIYIDSSTQPPQSQSIYLSDNVDYKTVKVSKEREDEMYRELGNMAADHKAKREREVYRNKLYHIGYGWI